MSPKNSSKKKKLFLFFSPPFAWFILQFFLVIYFTLLSFLQSGAVEWKYLLYLQHSPYDERFRQSLIILFITLIVHRLSNRYNQHDHYFPICFRYLLLLFFSVLRFNRFLPYRTYRQRFFLSFPWYVNRNALPISISGYRVEEIDYKRMKEEPQDPSP